MEGINSLSSWENKAHKEITSRRCPRSTKVSLNSSEFPDMVDNLFLQKDVIWLPKYQIQPLTAKVALFSSFVFD